jgi:hypothetical protein
MFLCRFNNDECFVASSLLVALSHMIFVDQLAELGSFSLIEVSNILQKLVDGNHMCFVIIWFLVVQLCCFISKRMSPLSSGGAIETTWVPESLSNIKDCHKTNGNQDQKRKVIYDFQLCKSSWQQCWRVGDIDAKEQESNSRPNLSSLFTICLFHYGSFSRPP